MEEEPKTNYLHHLSQVCLKQVSCKSATVVLSPDPLVLPVCSLGSWQQSHFYWHWIRLDWSSFVEVGNKKKSQLCFNHYVAIAFRRSEAKTILRTNCGRLFRNQLIGTNTGKSASLLLTNWTLSNNPQVTRDQRNLPNQPNTQPHKHPALVDQL